MRLHEITHNGRNVVDITFYHLTDSARLPSIMAVGLDPNMSREPAFRGRYVYLASDPDHARGYAFHHNDWEGKPVLLEIDPDQLDSRLLGPDDVDLPDMLDDRDWRDVNWIDSLSICGQCTYAGLIPHNAIRVVD